MKKKTDFKKLALMGITGGITLCSSASASPSVTIDNTTNLLAAGCGGKSGCGGNLTAYQPHGCGGAQPQSYYNNAPNQGQPGNASCGGASRPSNGHSCNAAPAPHNGNHGGYTAYQPHGCGGHQPNVYYNNNGNQMPGQNSAPSGCHASNKPNGSCAAAPKPANGQGQPQAYNQWQRGNAIAENAPHNGKSAEDAKMESQLNEEGKLIYRGLDPAGKSLANQLINQSCKGKNDCKGLNSCKTNENSCAGKGGCKGKSPGPFKDKNEAVKVAAQKMAEKRAGAAVGSPKY